MKLLKISSIGYLILFLFIFLTTPVLAAGTLSTPNTSTKDVNTQYSNVSVQNVTVVSQKGSVFNLSFDIVNSTKALAGIRYSIKLVGETAVGQYIADEYVYPDTLSLSPNNTLKKDILYNAPSGLSGDYTMIINVTNSSGLPLGIGIVGKIKNISTLDTVEILSNTCYLSVPSERENIKYSLSQGIDIAPSEKLALNCSIVNHSKEAVSSVPSYETHYRTLAGEIVTQEKGDTTPISFGGGETKAISLTLPKALKPQAYDTKVLLSTNGTFSNFVVVHYVLRGISATVQNFSLDKDYYKNKDTAQISLSWSPSADSFPGNRSGKSSIVNVSLVAKIVNDKQKDCITPINKVLDNTGTVQIAAPIIANCNNPIATLELTDSSGNILDQKILSFESKIQMARSGLKILLIIFGALIVVGLTIYFINLKKKGYVENNLSKSNETNIQ